MSKYDFTQPSKPVRISKLLDGRPKTYRVIETQVAEVEDLRRLPEGYFGKDVRLMDCPLCWGTGVVGDIDGMTTQAAEAYHFGGDNLRECPLCKGSGKMLQDMWLESNALIRISDKAAVSAESKIRMIKARERVK